MVAVRLRGVIRHRPVTSQARPIGQVRASLHGDAQHAVHARIGIVVEVHARAAVFAQHINRLVCVVADDAAQEVRPRNGDNVHVLENVEAAHLSARRLGEANGQAGGKRDAGKQFIDSVQFHIFKSLPFAD